MKGFTLIEFLITASIIGILSAIVVPNVLTYQKKHAEAQPVEDPRTPEQKDQEDYKVKKLFTVDGCAVYSFHVPWDGGQLVCVCPDSLGGSCGAVK